MPSTVWRLFNLRRDQDDPGAIDADIRAGAQPVGANLWVLFFAILTASVGLNVNSTAVIVGAMLISPLMGPILAIGYGAAVHDLPLIRQGARALGIFSLISLLTSTLYFALSPLQQPGTELLARTTPTLWDVLIAAFGGAAGMIAATRKEVTNVVPGVAIATALMPPLCTAGFGLAHARWDMLAGAVYLFVINGVFIAAATLTISKLLRLPRRGNVDEATRRMHRLVIVVGIVAVLAPSVWLGYRFVQHEVFASGAARVARQIEAESQFDLVSHQVDADRRVLRFTLVGARNEARVRDLAQALMQREGLGDASVEIHRAGDTPIDLGRLRSEFKADVERTVVRQLQIDEGRIQQIEAGFKQLRDEAAARKTPQIDVAKLRQEVSAQLPVVLALTLAIGARAAADQGTGQDAALVIVETRQALKPEEKSRLQRWLAIRLERPDLQLMEQVVPGKNRRG